MEFRNTMAKWVALFFVLALVGSGWWASEEGAPDWAPAAPTLVLASAVIAGLVHAVRHGVRRQIEMADIAARMGMSFEKRWPRDRFRELGLGCLKLFVYCRPTKELPFLKRPVGADFWNVMVGTARDAELYVFDYTTATRSGGASSRGTFVCFHTQGMALPDVEIVPRLWGAGPAWLKELTVTPPVRHALPVDDAPFEAEYRVETADETGARRVLSDALRRFLSAPGQTGWRLEMSGPWLAVTRLAPVRSVGWLTEPMAPETVPRAQRTSYVENPVGTEHVPALIEIAGQLHDVVAAAVLR